jgi:hypothetical protein
VERGVNVRDGEAGGDAGGVGVLLRRRAAGMLHAGESSSDTTSHTSKKKKSVTNERVPID